MRLALTGLGTTGSHIARQASQSAFDELHLFDSNEKTRSSVVSSLKAIARDGQRIIEGPPTSADPVDVVVIATPAGTHVPLARTMLAAGSSVVSISDDPVEVEALLALDDLAQTNGRSLVVGSGFSPGLSCLLVRFVADQLDQVDVINTYTAATAGPACARRHHQALQGSGYEWLEGDWVLRRGGSGRDLAWFPDPFGAKDCYRGALADPLLIQPVFPQATRISARMAATRRDRVTSRLPMLRPPHQDGGPGAIRVEVRGRRQKAVETLIVGVMDHPSVAAATVAAEVAAVVAAGGAPLGAHGLASWPDPKSVLRVLNRKGVRVAQYSGVLDMVGA